MQHGETTKFNSRYSKIQQSEITQNKTTKIAKYANNCSAHGKGAKCCWFVAHANAHTDGAHFAAAGAVSFVAFCNEATNSIKKEPKTNVDKSQQAIPLHFARQYVVAVVVFVVAVPPNMFALAASCSVCAGCCCCCCSML